MALCFLSFDKLRKLGLPDGSINAWNSELRNALQFLKLANVRSLCEYAVEDCLAAAEAVALTTILLNKEAVPHLAGTSQGVPPIDKPFHLTGGLEVTCKPRSSLEYIKPLHSS